MGNILEMKKARTGDAKRGTRANLQRPSLRQVSKAEVDCRQCNLMTPAWRRFCIHCGSPFSEETQDLLLSS